MKMGKTLVNAGSQLALGALAAFLACHAPAKASTPAYCATLSGGDYGATTGSAATGSARVTVNTDAQTINLRLAVAGIAIADLSDRLRAAPVGPIHLHLYPSHDHSSGAPVMLAMPVPFGAEYTAAQGGFAVELENYAYAKGAELLGSSLGFDEFVQALNAGMVVLNIHTNRFPDGEISGTVMSDCGTP